jgi:predicted ArsR family transcriptional regulator
MTTVDNDRFFTTTRGRIVALLRRSNKTVNDLVADLELTDNAIRAHLMSLERDGLVTQRGTIKGHRKPHNVYGLSDRARDLFPRPYGILFNHLLSTLKATVKRSAVIEHLKSIGRSIGSDGSLNISGRR